MRKYSVNSSVTREPDTDWRRTVMIHPPAVVDLSVTFADYNS